MKYLISVLTIVFVLITIRSFAQQPGEASAPSFGYLDFDGTNDYVQINNSSAINFSGDFTLEAKFKRQRMGVREEIMDKKELISGSPSQNDVAIYIDVDDKLVFYLGMGTNWLILKSTSVINTTDWYHVAATRQGNTAKIYLNGVLENTGTHTFSSVSNGPLRLGSNRVESPLVTAPPVHLFDGTMDEVRIWSVARTLTQIANNLSNELVGNETGLDVYYNFNQGTPCANNPTITTLLDGTSNVLNGALTDFDLTGTLSDPCQSNWAGVWPTNLNYIDLSKVKIGPIPFLDEINIQIPEGVNLSEIFVLDAFGRQVASSLSKSNANYKLAFNENVAPGICFLKLGNKVGSSSVVKIFKK